MSTNLSPYVIQILRFSNGERLPVLFRRQTGEPVYDANLYVVLNFRNKGKAASCSGLMYPDTDLGENARNGEVFDEQAKTYIFP